MPADLLRRVKDRIKRTCGIEVPKRGEIMNDEFAEALTRQAADPNVHSILEVGSSTGEGSTQALLAGMRSNPSHPRLFCIEAVQDRFALLVGMMRSQQNVFCHNVASVSLDKTLSEEAVRAFLKVTDWNASEKTVLEWRAGELEYIRAHHIPTDGIAAVKREHGVEKFDLVLLDGSEFTAYAELDEIYGARTIALDDVKVLKNHANLMRLIMDQAYCLIESNLRVRNGYAIFRRR